MIIVIWKDIATKKWIVLEFATSEGADEYHKSIIEYAEHRIMFNIENK
jgi:hypothetical protein